ncbi:MAG: 2-hydroxyhepta-2,4-diene-1,7-dioate isomerase [Bacteroidetes bacterium GWA2_32_17]|nr:MAG: 2-hydroxyhepta-2,4-diene-1,7-dioate isomerase [Bacteroidetes bacterium GWA2_32_17]
MKIICVGRNYKEHAKELKNAVPTEPVIFLKPDSAILNNNQPFFIPDFSKNLHYEVEIVFKICKVGKTISARFAHRYYDKIAIGIDFTARDIQENCRKKGLPWEISKAFDSSAAISKFIAKSEFENINNITFSLLKNEKQVQLGDTSDMIFSIDNVIAYVSNYFTLKTGDLIYTGTPAGVGPVCKGDNLKAFIGEKKMMDFYIQ